MTHSTNAHTHDDREIAAYGECPRCDANWDHLVPAATAIRAEDAAYARDKEALEQADAEAAIASTVELANHVHSDECMKLPEDECICPDLASISSLDIGRLNVGLLLGSAVAVKDFDNRAAAFVKPAKEVQHVSGCSFPRTGKCICDYLKQWGERTDVPCAVVPEANSALTDLENLRVRQLAVMTAEIKSLNARNKMLNRSNAGLFVLALCGWTLSIARGVWGF